MGARNVSLIESRRYLLLYLASLLSLLNALWLGYVGWQKSQVGGCPSCHLVPFLPITDVAVAIAGMVASFILAALCYFTILKKGLKYITLIYAAFGAAFFASFANAWHCKTRRYISWRQLCSSSGDTCKD